MTIELMDPPSPVFHIIPRPVFTGYPAFFAEAAWFINYLREVHTKEYTWLDLDGFQGLITKSFAAKKALAEVLGMGPDYRKTISYHDPETLKDVESYWQIKTLAHRNGIEIDHDDVYSGKIKDEHGRSQKLSRFLTKKLPKEFRNCTHPLFGVTECYCQVFNLSSVLSTLMEETAKLKKKITISCNPMDIFYSSENAGFSSCHSLSTETSENPCHRSGNVGYMLDNHTFICYTALKGSTDPIPYKTGRMLGYISSDRMHILAMRRYGDFPEAGAKEVTQNLTNAISKRLGIAYDWYAKDKPGFDCNWGMNGATHYMDTAYVSRYSYHLSQHAWDFKLGFVAPICLSCGKEHSQSEELFCDDCHYPFDCHKCKSLCRRNSPRDEYGNVYCPDCVSHLRECNSCNTVRSPENFQTLDGIEMCGQCYGYNSRTCPDCNVVYNRAHRRFNPIRGVNTCPTCDDARLRQEAEAEARADQARIERREREFQNRARMDEAMRADSAGRRLNLGEIVFTPASVGLNNDGTPRNPARVFQQIDVIRSNVPSLQEVMNHIILEPVEQQLVAVPMYPIDYSGDWATVVE